MRIRFIHPWRGRQPGQIDTALDTGVAVELVRRKIAAVVHEVPETVNKDSRQQQRERRR